MVKPRKVIRRKVVVEFEAEFTHPLENMETEDDVVTRYLSSMPGWSRMIVDRKTIKAQVEPIVDIEDDPDRCASTNQFVDKDTHETVRLRCEGIKNHKSKHYYGYYTWSVA